MALWKLLFVACASMVIGFTIGDVSENYVRLVDNIDQMFHQLQEANQINKRDLHELIDRKTQQLRNLMLEHKLSLARVPSEIVSKLAREELPEAEESFGGACPLQRAVLSMLRDNPSNLTTELFYRLVSATQCEAESSEEEEVPGERCHPVPMYPEDTVELFKLKARGQRTCSNLSPVQGLNKCHGGCESQSAYKSKGKRMRIVTTCSCCQPARFEKIEVLMSCNNGANFTKTYDNIAECRCLNCGGDREDGDDEDSAGEGGRVRAGPRRRPRPSE